MKTDLLAKRFEELTAQLAEVEATKRHRDGDAFMQGDYIDNDLYIAWKIKARNLLSKACGEASEHYRTFVSLEKGIGYATNYDIMRQLKAAFGAAREDFEGGYCQSVRALVQAEVFSDELDQARDLGAAGYHTAAAVIAGVVLETALREVCAKQELPVGKLDKMNADLAKAGQYTLLVQKRITALADIRNNAAHGHPDKYTASDVEDMIDKVEGIIADHL